MTAASSLRPIDGERVTVQGPMVSEPPRPLFRAMPAAEPFPIESLGLQLRQAVEAVTDLTQASPAICANSVLAVASLAV